MPAPKPTIYLIAGCNGAGKTTFAKEFLPHEVKCLRFYNADEIARGLSPLDPIRRRDQSRSTSVERSS
jgi:predicted ABC-type ATPase